MLHAVALRRAEVLTLGEELLVHSTAALRVAGPTRRGRLAACPAKRARAAGDPH